MLTSYNDKFQKFHAKPSISLELILVSSSSSESKKALGKLASGIMTGFLFGYFEEFSSKSKVKSILKY